MHTNILSAIMSVPFTLYSNRNTANAHKQIQQLSSHVRLSPITGLSNSSCFIPPSSSFCIGCYHRLHLPPHAQNKWQSVGLSIKVNRGVAKKNRNENNLTKAK
uniref:Uncharacterized protein n=1 Tax=Trypanosoma congolense (strain IL3000) TaxID=1068625 RepID=G0ULA2_TRYCI|nr:hypothetical protein, unlikely [Trypanosoma congolense IL3000]